MDQVNVAVAVAGFVVIALGFVSARLETLPLSGPILATAAGVSVGPELLGWLAADAWSNAHLILKELARFTLALSVFGIALRTPRRSYRKLLRPVGLLLTFGMLAMWAASAGIAHATLGLPVLAALLLGATVTPTDPVVASSIVTGGLAEQNLPDRLRSTLSLESGANDGLAYVIVLLPILLLGSATPAPALERWLLDVLLVGVVVAVAFGAATGYAAAVALRRADERGWVEGHSLVGLSVALSIFVVTVSKLIGSDGILAAFVAGAAFNFGIDRKEEFEEENVQEAISKLLNLPIFVVFGAMLPWRDWLAAGWPVLAFAVGTVLLRRPLALCLAGPFLGLPRRDAVFLGWFGPVGVAAIYYAILAEERTQDSIYWTAASLAITVSILAHGVTSASGIATYRRVERADRPVS